MADQMACPECNTVLVQVKRDSFISAGGCLSAAFFLLGLMAFAINVVSGIVCWAIAIVLSAMRSKEDWLMCPKCKKDIVNLS